MTTKDALTKGARREAGEASDIEHRLGHGGNMRDAGPGAEEPKPKASDVLGGSGHVPQLEEIKPEASQTHTGSAGADADRLAAERSN